MRALEKLLTSQSQSSHEGSHRQPSRHQPSSSSSPHSPAHPLAARSQLSAPAPPPRCLQHIHLPNTHLPPPPTTPLLALPCASAPHRLARPPLTTPRPSAHSTLHSPLRPPAFEQRLRLHTSLGRAAAKPCVSLSRAAQQPPSPSTPNANRQHGRRRVMIGTARRTASAPPPLLGPPMRLPLPPHALSPLPCRTTPLPVRVFEPG